MGASPTCTPGLTPPTAHPGSGDPVPAAARVTVVRGRTVHSVREPGALSGATFDYALDRDTVHISVTDPMGHDIDAALAATVLVGALRGARLAEQDHLADHNRGNATGQLLRINLHPGRSQLANAGHPWPLRMREGVAETVTCEVDHPLGLSVRVPHPYCVQDLDPGIVCSC